MHTYSMHQNPGYECICLPPSTRVKLWESGWSLTNQRMQGGANCSHSWLNHLKSRKPPQAFSSVIECKGTCIYSHTCKAICKRMSTQAFVQSNGHWFISSYVAQTSSQTEGALIACSYADHPCGFLRQAQNKSQRAECLS
jgi:hypothetical protein